MKIKVSNPLADFINMSAKTNGKKYSAKVVKLSPRNYSALVGDIFDAEYYGDYDIATGTAKAICVTYPAEYYANNRYLSTSEILSEFRRNGCKTAQDLIRMFVDMLEI